ncbi:hypothetical protein V2J09_009068 [Rumex salicifolius]
MRTNLPIDELYANEISALLNPLPAPQIQEYFDDLIKKRRYSGLKVKQNVELGKGIYSDMALEEEDLIFKDQMIVGFQHSSNKIDCHVCSFCFRFLGSIELQIGRKLYLQEMGLCSNNECHSNSSDEDGDSCMNNHDVVGPAGECSTSSSLNKIPLPKEIVDLLMNGELRLPHSEKFLLPSAIPCFGGCGESFYCRREVTVILQEGVIKIYTNDIFLLAAKAICFTILRYRKMKEPQLKNLHCSDATINGNESVDLPLLLEAWKPISMGYKRRWWDCIALPEDVDESGEVAFRNQIKELALTDRDGQATIIALCSIQVGEEVTISYIDEELPYEERQALLADYGFICKCSRCQNQA